MRRLFIMTVMVAAVMGAAPAFALIDGELFGGYSFMGNYKTDTTSVDVKGYNYGGRAHVTNGGLLFVSGLGLYMQKTPLKYDIAARDVKMKKVNIGPDAYMRLNLIPILKPFIRGGVSFYEYLDAGTGVKTEKKYFNSYYYGVGLGLGAPSILFDLMIYGEYLNHRRFGSGDKLTLHTFNFGVALGI